MAISLKPAGSAEISKLVAQYKVGFVKFTGTVEALCERNLLSDKIVDAGLLGNGGLRRLAACFLDSIATMDSSPNSLIRQYRN